MPAAWDNLGVQAIAASHARYLSHFPVRTGDRFVVLRLGEIRWIEAQANYVRVHTGEGAYLQRDSLRRLQGLLDPERFLRISRSTIVNLDLVRAVERAPNGSFRLELEGGERLTASRAYRSVLRGLLRREARPQPAGRARAVPVRDPRDAHELVADGDTASATRRPAACVGEPEPSVAAPSAAPSSPSP